MDDGILSNFIKEVTEAIRRQVPNIAKEAKRRAYADYFSALGQAMQSIFDNAIQEFYSSYSPDYYTRNESLYNILQLDFSDTYIEIEFDPNEMTPFRSGYTGEDGLYDQVFRKGWHGGAGSGKGHPNEGTPYWRTPVGGYFHWGREAEKTEVSPLEVIKRRFEEYQKKEGSQLFKKAYKKHVGNISRNLELNI